jgi:pilus assembly protein CpaE
MRIKVVSPNPVRAEHVAQMVRIIDPEFEVQAATAAAPGPSIINGSRPGLLIFDAVDANGLDAIGQLTHAHPDVEAIVISAEQSPAFLMKAMQAGVREVLPPPLDAPALQAAVQRATRKRKPQATPPQLGEVFVFMACKGGSGASFLAANFAHALSTRDGRTVALLDLDLQFGDTLLMLGDHRAGSDVAEVAHNIARLDAELLRSAMVATSTTLSVLAAPQELSQALEVKASHVEAIVRQARQMFDFVVIDVGRSIDGVSLKALDMATRIFPVVQLSLPQVRDARRLQTLFRSLDYSLDKIHWIVNRYQKTADITLESFEHSLGLKNAALIPNHFNLVNASVNQGVPIEKLSRKSPVALALRALAKAVAPPIDDGRHESRWLSTLFGGNS